MYLIILDVNDKVHLIDHKSKKQCITICGLNILSDRKNIIALDEEISNICQDCMMYHNMVYGKSNNALHRNITQEHLITKYLNSVSIENKYKSMAYGVWNKLKKFKKNLKRK